MSNQRVRFFQTFKNPLTFSLIGDNIIDGIFSYKGGNVLSGIVRSLKLFFRQVDTKLLFVEVASNSRVSVFDMPEAAENVKPATPNRLRPANRNGSFALLSSPALKKQMVQIDNRGNVFLLDYSRLVRWKKSSVYIADRTAFR